jgi:heme-degrading monooxygenase HmoA
LFNRGGRGQKKEEATMSVIMTMRVEGDGSAAERFAAEEPSTFSKVIEKAKEEGLISHHFYASDKEILVVDEWPSEEAFQTFFDHAGAEIQQIMGSAGVKAEPVITFWRHLATGDDVG